MLWLAVSPRGVSKLYFCKSGGALKVETYRQECVAKRLMPFMDSKHKREDVLFWPDLASCHYARQTQEFPEREGIPFVPKEQNPPCCPQLRPIEDVWAILKAKTYEGGWEATSELQLKRRIRQCIEALNQEVLKTMMGRCHSACARLHVQGHSSLCTKWACDQWVSIFMFCKYHSRMNNT